MRRLAALDRAAALRVARSDSWPAGHVLPGLPRLADHGFLWIVLATVLWATGKPQITEPPGRPARQARVRGRTP